MHPILKRRSRLVLYLAVWIVFGLLLTVVFIFGGRAPPLWSLYFAVPMAMLLGMQSLSYWYLVQSMPPGETPIVRMVISWVAAGLASLVAGHIVQRAADGRIVHYEIAGYVVVTTALIASFLLWRLQRGLASPVAVRA